MAALTRQLAVRGARYKTLDRLVTAVLVALILFVVFLRFSPSVSVYRVLSSSMSPQFNSGDLVVTRRVSGDAAATIAVGRVITFMVDGQSVTHRIVGLTDGMYITKGDANESPDRRPVAPSQVNGVFLFSIPMLGSIVAALRSSPLYSIVIPSAVLIVITLWELWKEIRRSRASPRGTGDGGMGHPPTGGPPRASPVTTTNGEV
jgi:signal peptidase I